MTRRWESCSGRGYKVASCREKVSITSSRRPGRSRRNVTTVQTEHEVLDLLIDGHEVRIHPVCNEIHDRNQMFVAFREQFSGDILTRYSGETDLQHPSKQR